MTRTWPALLTSCLAAQLSNAQPSEIAVTHVTIVSPAAGKAFTDRTIVIRGGRIVAAGPARSVRFPASARVLDGTGKFAVPGLWDMHSHLRSSGFDLELNIANGVLGIRNIGGAVDEVFPLREAVAAGKRLGPLIITSGPILDGPNSFASPKLSVSVKTPEEARQAVRNLKQQGSDFIKPYDQLTRELYFAVIDEAKKQGIPVAGHVPGAISIREASKAGQRSAEHGMPLAGGSTAEQAYMTRRSDQSAMQEALRTKNFSLIPAKIARDETAMLDTFSRARADETYRLLAHNRTFLTPTLVTQKSLTFIDDLSLRADPRMQYVRAEDLERWKPENGMLTRYRTPEYIAMRKRQYTKMLEEIPRARALGVRLLAGTDITIPHTYPGFSVHEELQLFVEAGLKPMEALETATTNPALLLGLSKTWGRVERGYLANLILLTGDPLEDITNLSKIDTVIRNGVVLDRQRLDGLLDAARKGVREPR